MVLSCPVINSIPVQTTPLFVLLMASQSTTTMSDQTKTRYTTLMNFTGFPHRIHKHLPTCFEITGESADGFPIPNYDSDNRSCITLPQLIPEHNGHMLLGYSSVKRPAMARECTNQTQPAKRPALAVDETNKTQHADAFHVMKQASKVPGAFLEDRLLSRVYEMLPRDPDGALDVAASKDHEAADTHPLLRVPFVAECYKVLSFQLKLSTNQPGGFSCDPTANPDTMPVHLMPCGITEGPPTPAVRYISIFYSGTGFVQQLVGLQFGYDNGLSAVLGKTHDLAGKPYHRCSYLLFPNEHILGVSYVIRQFSDKPRFITHIAFNTTCSWWWNRRPLYCSCKSDPGSTDCKEIYCKHHLVRLSVV